jgi:hypothetical protein
MTHRKFSTRRLAALLATFLAAVAAVAATSSPVVQAAATPTATSLVVVDANVTGVVKPDAPWSQPPFMVSGALHTVHLNFFIGTTPAPLSTGGRGTSLTFAIVNGTTVTDLKTYLVPPDVTTFTVTDLPTAAPANDVLLRATAATSKQSPLVGTLGLSILRSYLNNVNGGSSLSSIGGRNSGLDSSCEATAQEPTCVDVILPAGAATSGNVILSLGTCQGLPDVCSDTMSYLELLMNVNPAVVTNTNPIKVLLKCDKTKCPGDPKQYAAFVRLTPTDAWAQAPYCQNKGVVDAGLNYCIDASNSVKNGAGDYVQTVLFITDPRAAPHG